MRRSVIVLMSFSIWSHLVGCGDNSNSGKANDNSIISIINGGTVAPGSSQPSTNPRYPGLKTYGTTNNGFYSIVKGASYTLGTDQTFFGASARSDSLLLALKRIDTSGFKWIDIYEIPILSGLLTFQCKIRDDGNFSAGIRFDNQRLYIKSNTYPITYRSFNYSDCVEGIALSGPNLSSPWSDCGNWDVFDGLLNLCQSSSATGQVMRSYSEVTGQIITSFIAPQWNDFNISFSQSSINRTPKGLWGMKPASGSANMVLYFIDTVSQVGDWGTLPSSDYTDLINDYQTTLYAVTEDDKNLYIVALKDKQLRYYILDIESF